MIVGVLKVYCCVIIVFCFSAGKHDVVNCGTELGETHGIWEIKSFCKDLGWKYTKTTPYFSNFVRRVFPKTPKNGKFGEWYHREDFMLIEGFPS